MADTVHTPHAAHDEEAAQNENRKFAMWLYLTSEVVIFSMLIAGYTIFRATQGTAVNLVKDALGIGLVTANTFVLLLSSYAMVMGLRAIRMGSRRGFYFWISLTAILGTVFLGGQYIEYSELGHLGISLDKQDFSVSTNIFESVNHVDATTAEVIVWTEQDGMYVAQELSGYEIEDLREVHYYASTSDIPAEMDHGIVVLPPAAALEDIQAIPNEGLVILQDAVVDNDDLNTESRLDFSRYHVDFVEEADLFADVNISDTAISPSSILIDYSDDFILLDSAQAPLADSQALEAAQLEIENGLRDLGIRRENLVPLSRLAVETLDGEIVPFSAVLAGQPVDLDPEQYGILNSYFRALIGDSASNYGMRFYAPTAFHGAHVAIGVLWALIVLWRGAQGYYDKNAIGLEMFGLYWHFVDVVWIVLFTLIYLV